MGKVRLCSFQGKWVTWLFQNAHPVSLLKFGILSFFLFLIWQGIAWVFYSTHGQSGLLELGGAPYWLQSFPGSLNSTWVTSLRLNLSLFSKLAHGVVSLSRIIPVIIFGVWTGIGIAYYYSKCLLAPRLSQKLLLLPLLYISSEILQTLSILWLLFAPQSAITSGVVWVNTLQWICFLSGIMCGGIVFLGWFFWKIMDFILKHTP